MGKIIRKTRIASDPDAFIDHVVSLDFDLKRIGLGKLGHCLNGCMKS